MQNDLISRSALLEAYHEMGISMNPDVFEEDVEELINNQPCAYDVEKVVAELEEVDRKANQCRRDAIALHNEEFWRGRQTGLYKAIEIVRKGGKE